MDIIKALTSRLDEHGGHTENKTVAALGFIKQTVDARGDLVAQVRRPTASKPNERGELWAQAYSISL